MKLLNTIEIIVLVIPRIVYTAIKDNILYTISQIKVFSQYSSYGLKIFKHDITGLIIVLKCDVYNMVAIVLSSLYVLKRLDY